MSSKDTPKGVENAVDSRIAKVRTKINGVKLKGFTLGRDKVVEGVPLAHAEFLQTKGQVDILEVR